MQIQQVAIAENMNPGAVEKVILYDIDGKSHIVFQGEASPVPLLSRVMNVTFIRTEYKVKAVELVLQCGKVMGTNEIDAIGIADTKTPIKAEPNLAPNSKIIGERENLGRGVNSVFDEVYPVISPDGKTLFIDRKNHPQNYGGSDNVWFSTLQSNGSWGAVQNIGPALNNGLGTYVASVTPDGNTLLLGGSFTDENTNQRVWGIWTASRETGGWGKPKRVRIDNFYTRNQFMEFCMANDGKAIIVALQRDDSNGERDLYACFIKSDGTWTAPKNLGPKINSLADEGMPFLASDGKSLYFGSDGYSGYGSVDMYVSRRLDDSWTNWSEPENLGPDLNTPEWDAYFTIPASGDYCYFVSSKGSYGNLDVFRAKLPESLRPSPVVLVSGKVFDKKTGNPIEAAIKYEMLPEGKEVGIAHSSPKTGEYKITLPAGALYGFRAETKGYIAISENIDLKQTKTYSEIKRDLQMVPLEVGQVVRMNNIFFEFAKADLKNESYSELDRLVEVLKSAPSMELQISGHTDNVGSDPQNNSLSEARAKAVKAYLLGKGIKSERLKTIGYGRTKPLATNDTEEGRQMNRRVEFTILKQ